MKCNHCSTDFEGKFCPQCGARADFGSPETAQQSGTSYFQTENTMQKKMKKKKKPFFRRWWFIAAVIIIAFIAFLSSPDTEKIIWDEMILAQVIPEAPKSKGKIWSNSSTRLNIDIVKISAAEYEAYIEDCKQQGFDIDAEKNSIFYEAYNAEGYNLYLSYSSYNETMGISVDAPTEMTQIKWPAGTAGKLLPVPESSRGKFNFEYEDSFSVLIAETTKDAFNEYVSRCSESGFNIDYDKSEKYYQADNADGWHISVRYEGFNIMSIQIEAPDENEEAQTEESTAEATTTQATTTEKTEDLVDGMRPEFKAAMDSYEAFMTEYVELMKKLDQDSGNLSLLAEYAEYMSKYADFVEDFEKWDDSEMNNTETAYYIDVQARVSKLLLEVE